MRWATSGPLSLAGPPRLQADRDLGSCQRRLRFVGQRRLSHRCARLVAVCRHHGGPPCAPRVQPRRCSFRGSIVERSTQLSTGEVLDRRRLGPKLTEELQGAGKQRVRHVEQSRRTAADGQHLGGVRLLAWVLAFRSCAKRLTPRTEPLLWAQLVEHCPLWWLANARSSSPEVILRESREGECKETARCISGRRGSNSPDIAWLAKARWRMVPDELVDALRLRAKPGIVLICISSHFLCL